MQDSRGRPGRDPRFALLLLCFLLSGFAALLYETAWTREFAFVFGTSELAVVSVLAAYMGGLAAGAAVAARVAGRLARPVLTYGVVELGIAGCAIAVPVAVRGVTWLYAALFGGLAAPPDEGGLAAGLFHVAGAFAVLLVPTALMGATLPLLARHAVRRQEDIGRNVGILYATNTAGAIGGTLCAAFVLLPSLGLRGTVYVGAATNVLVFAAAALLARGVLPVSGAARPAAVGGARWILPLAGLSGAVSFVYEILWVRLLGQLLGGSVPAFATMLASFLLGIAAGSAVASRLATSADRAARAFAVAQVGTALLSLAAFAAVDQLPELAVALGAGGRGSLAANALLAGLVLVPPALCIGATVPCAIRVLALDATEAPAAAARVLAWNTLGAIVGSVAAGFWILPLLSYAGTATLAIAANLALAGATGALHRPPLRPALALAAAGACALALAAPRTPWTLLRTSPLNQRPVGGPVTYLGVGRSATVLVLEDARGWKLATNGLPESIVLRADERPGQYLEARWLTLLPALARPEARSLLLIGLGGGLAVEAVPATFEEVDVIELEPEVVAANRAIAARRGIDPLADPRVRVRLNDARGALTVTSRRWDAIVSQPSHPWTAGASHLYTKEFFGLVREHLTEDGVFVQWIGLHFVDASLLRSLVATLLGIFPEVRVYEPTPGAVLFLASETPLAVEAGAPRALAADPEGFARYGLRIPEDVAASLVLDEQGARRFAAGATPNSDDRNQLAMRSARILGNGLDTARSDELLLPFDALAARVAGDADGDRAADVLHIVRSVRASSGAARALWIARAIPEPATRLTAIGWVHLEEGRPLAAARHFDDALARDRDLGAARFGWLRAQRYRLETGDPDALARAAGLPDPAAAVVEGWRLAAAGDFAALRALEPRLAAAGPPDPAAPDALRLRALWRIESGGRHAAGEALALVDDLLLTGSDASDLVLRTRAAEAAGRPAAAWSALERATQILTARGSASSLAREARALAERLPDDPRSRALRARLARLAP